MEATDQEFMRIMHANHSVEELKEFYRIIFRHFKYGGA